MVMAEALTLVAANVLPLAMWLMLLAAVVPPVTLTVTAALVLNANPLGAANMMVPVPMAPMLLLSTAIGPVSVVQEPAAVSAEIAEPPVAAVMVTVA